MIYRMTRKIKSQGKVKKRVDLIRVDSRGTRM